SITSIGGLVGVWPKTYVSTKTPKLPHNPRPTPPYRLPIKMHASTTANSRQFTKVSIGTPCRLKNDYAGLPRKTANSGHEQRGRHTALIYIREEKPSLTRGQGFLFSGFPIHRVLIKIGVDGGTHGRMEARGTEALEQFEALQ